MGYWDCPKCAAENSLDAYSCWRCGFRNYGEAGPAARADVPASSRQGASGSVARQRDRLREDLRKRVEGGLDRDRATIDRLARRGGGGGKTDKGT